MKMKAFKIDRYHAQGELVILKEPTTPFERGIAVVRIQTQAEIGSSAYDCRVFGATVKTFLAKYAKKDIRVESENESYGEITGWNNTITFSFQY